MQHFPPDFLLTNRKNLCKKLDQDSLILIPSGKEIFRFAGMTYPFSPNPSFFYFTGIAQAECLLLLIPYSPSGKHSILFIPQTTEKKAQWDGKNMSKEEAKKISGIDEIEYLESFSSMFQAQQNWKTKLYVENNSLRGKDSLRFFSDFIQQIQHKNPALEIKKLDPYIVKLRSKKQPLEIEAIQKAIDITYRSLLKVWSKTPDSLNEKELEAQLTYYYQILGANGHAFSPIIASGVNAIILHYLKNNAILQKENLLLIDTGACWQYYNADITRVIPLAKKFTEKQRKYYELVLEMQQKVIEILNPQITWWELYHHAEKIQGKILKKAGIIKDETEHKPFTIHRIGHSLGLEVHDICDQDTLLEIGTVLTIEPGLYLPEEGIGIRIEDNIFITEKGNKNLSAQIPKSIEDIENIF